jgi:uncharacterized membrane protein YeaQ/YmgE (transglycosylase-associated protein family)
MELLFVILIAAGIGFLAHYTIPGRDKRGSLLLASISAAVAAAACVGLLWLGFTYDGGWIWAISLTVGGLVAIIVAAVLPKRRRVADRAMLTKLSGGRA